MSDVTSTRLAENLRDALKALLAAGTWDVIEKNFARVGLGWHEELEPGWGKPTYVGEVLNLIGDEDLVAVASRAVAVLDGSPAVIAVEDALSWLEAGGTAQITEVTRLALADALDDRVLDPDHGRVSVLARFSSHPAATDAQYKYGEDGCLLRREGGLFAALAGDSAAALWTESSHRDLFRDAGLFEWPDRRLFQFLQAVVRPEIRKGEDQREWVSLLNAIVAADGWQLVASSEVSGHPVFTMQRRSLGVAGRPKNLIFASTGPKPEIGFRDAINNDIEILRHGEHCLVYDERLPDDGLLWHDLAAWWARTTEFAGTETEARTQLGQRLQASLGSQVESYLFAQYFKCFAPRLGAQLPALLRKFTCTMTLSRSLDYEGEVRTSDSTSSAWTSYCSSRGGHESLSRWTASSTTRTITALVLESMPKPFVPIVGSVFKVTRFIASRVSS